MGEIDISAAERPERVRVGGVDVERMKEFRRRFPPAAKRHLYIRDHILFPERDPKPNPEQMAEEKTLKKFYSLTLFHSSSFCCGKKSFVASDRASEDRGE